MNLSAIIEEVATQCDLSIIYLQEDTKTSLENKKCPTHIINKSLRQALDNLLLGNDFYYILHKDTLQIGSLLTKTFEINYIATTRVGSSNTDIVFSQDNQIQSPYTQSTPMAISNFEIQSQAHKMAMSKATQNNQSMGKSGTKIYSIDEIDFWGDLHQEIRGIAYAPGDIYQPKNKELHTKGDIIINKAAGLLTITATPSQMRRVEQYIARLNERIQQQVLIDVHIYNVSLTDNQAYGVDWNEFYKLGNLMTLPPTNTSGDSNNGNMGGVSVNTGGFALNIFSQGVSLNRVLEFLQTYGKVRSLSNPKVLTLNNQPAIISVGSVLRYSQNTTYQTTTQGTSVQNNSQAFPSVFAGILLDVTPSIKGNKIILKINPSITKTKDMAVENQSTALSSPPNLSTKQLSSLVQVQDGQHIVLGGLIDKVEGKVVRKIPILGDIPLLKYLFSYTTNTKETQEMVIIISPHIVRFNKQTKEQIISQAYKDEIADFAPDKQPTYKASTQNSTLQFGISKSIHTKNTSQETRHDQ